MMDECCFLFVCLQHVIRPELLTTTQSSERSQWDAEVSPSSWTQSPARASSSAAHGKCCTSSTVNNLTCLHLLPMLHVQGLFVCTGLPNLTVFKIPCPLVSIAGQLPPLIHDYSRIEYLAENKTNTFSHEVSHPEVLLSNTHTIFRNLGTEIIFSTEIMDYAACNFYLLKTEYFSYISLACIYS